LPTGEHLADVAGVRDCRRVGAAWARVVVVDAHVYGRKRISLQTADPSAYKVMMPRLTPSDRRVRAIISVQLDQDILYAAFGRFLRNVQAGAISLLA